MEYPSPLFPDLIPCLLLGLRRRDKAASRLSDNSRDAADEGAQPGILPADIHANPRGTPESDGHHLPPEGKFLFPELHEKEHNRHRHADRHGYIPW